MQQLAKPENQLYGTTCFFPATFEQNGLLVGFSPLRSDNSDCTVQFLLAVFR
jgi:hypothetical protein